MQEPLCEISDKTKKTITRDSGGKMKKIKISLEYKCYPLWVYDQDNNLINNDLVGELKNEIEIENQLNEIQEIFNGLFEDNPILFEYKGFSKMSDKENLQKKINKLILEIEEKIGNKYIIENKINLD